MPIIDTSGTLGAFGSDGNVVPMRIIATLAIIAGALQSAARLAPLSVPSAVRIATGSHLLSACCIHGKHSPAREQCGSSVRRYRTTGGGNPAGRSRRKLPAQSGPRVIPPPTEQLRRHNPRRRRKRRSPKRTRNKAARQKTRRSSRNSASITTARLPSSRNTTTRFIRPIRVRTVFNPRKTRRPRPRLR